MKALLWTAAETIEWTDVPKPAIEAHEVLVRVRTIGICGSDLEGYLGHNSLGNPPLLMGHEFAGTIEEAGAAAGGLGKGRRVVVNPLSSCGRCRHCRTGLKQLCGERRIVGIHRPGAYAEYVAVPADRAVLIPDSLPFEAAALTEPLACALRAARRAMEGRAFPNVAVLGAGAIGLLSAMSVRLLGASNVYVLDVNEARLQLAERLRLGVPVFAGDGASERLQRLGGERGIDVVIDAAGFQPTRSLAASIVNPGGVIMNIGLGIDETTVPINRFIRSEVDVKGSFCYADADFHDALHLLASGTADGEGWTETRPLSAGPASFRELADGRCAVGKILLQP